LTPLVNALSIMIGLMSGTWAIRRFTILSVFCSILVSSITDAGEFGYDASLKIGPEADSNANRVPKVANSFTGNTPPDPENGLLLRTMAEINGQFNTPGSSTSLGYEGGYKFFLDPFQRAANEHVHRLRLNAVQRLAKDWELSERFAYFDDFLRVSTRDFRRGEMGVEIGRWLSISSSSSGRSGTRDDQQVGAGDRIRIGINPLVSALQYKPADGFSFLAPGVLFSTGYYHPINSQSTLRISLSEIARYRLFRGNAFCEPGTCQTGRKMSRRRDFNSLTQIRMSIDSDVLFSLWYGLEINRSSSFGESYRRQIIGLDVTAPITDRFFFSGQAVYQLSAFADTLFGQSIQQLVVPVEQENRSRLVVRFGYDWTDWLSSSIWYSLFVNESGTTTQGQAIPGYFRQTLFAGMEFRASGSR